MTKEQRRLQQIRDFIEAWLSPEHLESGIITHAEQQTLRGVWRVGEFGTLPNELITGKQDG